MQHKHFTCTITFKRLKEDFQKKELWMAIQTYKKQLIYSIQPLTTFKQSKNFNIEVEILTMIYYLKIEHIHFLTHQSSVQ